MELQCKERVDLLNALKRSRSQANDTPSDATSTRTTTSSSHIITHGSGKDQPGWIGHVSVPTVSYPDLSKPAPPLPRRPPISGQKHSDSRTQRLGTPTQSSYSETTAQYPTTNLSVLSKQTSRTPSPEKKSRLLTTLRTGKDARKASRSRDPTGRIGGPPAASKAAGLAWDSISRSSGRRLGQSLANQSATAVIANPNCQDASGYNSHSNRASGTFAGEEISNIRCPSSGSVQSPDLISLDDVPGSSNRNEQPESANNMSHSNKARSSPQNAEDLSCLLSAPSPTPNLESVGDNEIKLGDRSRLLQRKPQPSFSSFRNELPSSPVSQRANHKINPTFNKPTDALPASSIPDRRHSPLRRSRQSTPVPDRRQNSVAASSPRRKQQNGVTRRQTSSESGDETSNSSRKVPKASGRLPRNKGPDSGLAGIPNTPPSTDGDSTEGSPTSAIWEERLAYVKNHLPAGIDEAAAKQIINEIVVQGDEVHWDDVAGLEVAKKALKEAVVYPFLRPDLFMGLREPARGMLLFGPPGTGKTMLARAVATESRSTFFAISASSLTSKFLGESEKLVRALFAMARALAPSIIFVDEIDSLLSSRGGSSEHEATRRIKTEFLIQWSDLQRAAAGKEQTEKEKRQGDASRVLVLAATNLPWQIDEAARRRFVRRQYIPLPESEVRAKQLRTLLGHQKHSLDDDDILVLVELTDGMK